ncbi:MAG TPA: pyridoxine 5'-phosphate synthase, partial [Holophaga sp.]|nr:pyridoxine 5'-phosphate synthase [Holophaga sp.]
GDLESVRETAAIGGDRIEIYTEPYAEAFKRGKAEAGLRDVVRSAEEAGRVGLAVNAGHDLTHENLPFLLQRIPGLAEVSIGHHLVCRALEVGIDQAVRDYLQAAHGEKIL